MVIDKMKKYYYMIESSRSSADKDQINDINKFKKTKLEKFKTLALKNYARGNLYTLRALFEASNYEIYNTFKSLLYISNQELLKITNELPEGKQRLAAFT